MAKYELAQNQEFWTVWDDENQTELELIFVTRKEGTAAVRALNLVLDTKETAYKAEAIDLILDAYDRAKISGSVDPLDIDAAHAALIDAIGAAPC